MPFINVIDLDDYKLAKLLDLAHTTEHQMCGMGDSEQQQVQLARVQLDAYKFSLENRQVKALERIAMCMERIESAEEAE